MPITPEERAKRVTAAISELASNIDVAVDTLVFHGPTDERTLAAWARVEQSGAIVHRQSRLLAGKSKGG